MVDVVSGGKKFKEIFKCEISPGRFIVCSRTFDCKISMAQLIRVKNSKDETIFLFLKNSFIFDTDKSFEEFKKNVSAVDLKKLDSKMSLKTDVTDDNKGNRK